MRETNVGRPAKAVVILVLATFAFVGTAQMGAAGTAADHGGAVTAPVSLRTLYANVYLQTSGEYRACCYGIYAAAARQLEELLEDAEPEPLRPAVVMDLDETVLDVSSFQTFLYENGLEYTPELWAEFERSGVEDVALVPGAREFIEEAEALGATVVFLSNRNRVNEASTIAALERLGIGTAGISERMYLKPEGGSSDKSVRRDAASSRYNVLMYFGDNLRDFSEIFAARELAEDATAADHMRAIEERSAAVDDAVHHWGVDWFVLPNPVYGEWEKLVSQKPEEVLRSSSMKMGGGSE